MSSYNIQFKAQDKLDEKNDKTRKYENEILQIFNAYKTWLNYEPQISFKEDDSAFYMQLSWKVSTEKIVVFINFEPNRLVYKRKYLVENGDEQYISPVLFRGYELKLFDALSFELPVIYKNKNLNQDITDWWKDKNVDSSKL